MALRIDNHSGSTIAVAGTHHHEQIHGPYHKSMKVYVDDVATAKYNSPARRARTDLRNRQGIILQSVDGLALSILASILLGSDGCTEIAELRYLAVTYLD